MDMSHYYHQEENRFRGAAHAGSWYTGNGKTISLVKSEREGGDYSSWKNQTYNSLITAPQLTADLLGWLRRVSPRHPGQQFPAIGCKGIIAPYDGFNHVLYDLTALSFVCFFCGKIPGMRAMLFPVRTLLGHTSALILPPRWFFVFFISLFLSLSLRLVPPSISTRFSFSRSRTPLILISKIAVECLFSVLHTTGESRRVHLPSAIHTTPRLGHCLWTQQVSV